MQESETDDRIKGQTASLSPQPTTHPAQPGLSPTVEQFWEAITLDKITEDTAIAIYRHLRTDVPEDVPEVKAEEFFEGWAAQEDQQLDFIAAVMGIAERKLSHEKVALCMLVQVGAIDEADKRFEAIVAQSGKDAPEKLRTKGALFTLVKPHIAIDAFQRLVAQEPGDLQAHLALARLLDQSGDLKSAESWYLRILQLPEVKPFIQAEVTTELASVKRRQGNLEEAYSRHQQSYQLYIEMGEKEMALEQINLLKGNAKEQGKIELEESWAEIAVQVHLDLGDTHWAAEILTELANNAMEHDILELAEDRTKRGLALYQQLEEKGGMAWGLTNLSAIASRRQDYRNCEKLAKQALSLHQELEDKELIIKTLYRLRGAAEKQDSWPRARSYLQLGLKLAQKWGHKKILGDVHIKLAQLAERRDGRKGKWQLFKKTRTGEAVNHKKQAIEYYQQAGTQESEAYWCADLGDHHFNTGDLIGAEFYYRRARLILEKTGDHLLMAAVLYEMGRIGLRLENWGAAELQFGRALAIYEGYNEKDAQERFAQTAAHLGDLHYRRGDIAGARDYWGKALTRYSNVGQRNTPPAQRLIKLLDMSR